MRKLLWIALAVTLALTWIACEKKPPPAAPAPTPAPLPDIELGGAEPMPSDQIVPYLEKQLTRAARTDSGDVDRLQINLKNHFGCLENNKTDDCRFILCSAPAIYAGDEAYQLGQVDDAFSYFTAAYNLLKEEVANNIERRNNLESEFEAAQKNGTPSDDDKRQYWYRRAILTQMLFRNQAEVSRVMTRLALCLSEQGDKENADNALLAGKTFLQAAADEYRAYYDVRGKLTALLIPGDPHKGENYKAELTNLDSLMLVRHF